MKYIIGFEKTIKETILIQMECNFVSNSWIMQMWQCQNVRKFESCFYKHSTHSCNHFPFFTHSRFYSLLYKIFRIKFSTLYFSKNLCVTGITREALKNGSTRFLKNKEWHYSKLNIILYNFDWLIQTAAFWLNVQEDVVNNPTTAWEEQISRLRNATCTLSI